MRYVLGVIAGAFLLSGCNIPLRYQDSNHYKSKQQAKSEKLMQEHLRVEALYIERAKLVANEVQRVGSGQVLNAAKQQVAESLKDPESARFKNVRFVLHEGGAMICGEVNGKNAYGGYVGYAAFLSDSKTSEIFDPESLDERFAAKIRSKCSAPVHDVFQKAIN